jgi:hypothetical protein
VWDLLRRQPATPGDDKGQAFLIDRTSTPSVALYAPRRSPTKLASYGSPRWNPAPLRLASREVCIKTTGSCRNHRWQNRSTWNKQSIQPPSVSTCQRIVAAPVKCRLGRQRRPAVSTKFSEKALSHKAAVRRNGRRPRSRTQTLATDLWTGALLPPSLHRSVTTSNFLLAFEPVEPSISAKPANIAM